MLLYELLTGSTPLVKNRAQGVAFLEMLRLIREEEPPRPSTRLSESGDALIACAVDRKTDSQKLPKLVKGELDWITMKALEKDRTRRYETASAMAADVQRYLRDEQVEACPPSFAYRLRKFASKHRTAFAMTSMAAGLLLFGIVATTWQAIRATLAEQAVADAQLQTLSERDEARKANVNLQAAQEDLRGTLYYARSNLLQMAWDANSIGQVIQLQEQQRPGPGERDLRDFEWHYRDRLCHLELLTISGLGGNRPPPIIPSFSPDGKYVVALAKAVDGIGFPGSEIAIYDLALDTERARLQIETDRPPTSFLWSPDSKFVLACRQSVSPFGGGSGGGGRKNPADFSADYQLYDAADGREVYRLSRTEAAKGSGPTPWMESKVEEAAFSSDGRHIAISSNLMASRGILIHDAATGKVLRKLAIPVLKRTNCIAFSADGSRLAAAIQQRRSGAMLESKPRIMAWDVGSGEELFSVESPIGDAEAIQFSSDGTKIAAICVNPKRSSAYALWDLASGKELNTFPIVQNVESDLVRSSAYRYSAHLFSPDGARLAFCPYAPNGTGELHIYDTATGKVVETLRDAASVGAMAFSPNGKTLAAAGSDSVIRVWDLGQGGAANGNAAPVSPACVLRGHLLDVRRLVFHPDGSRLFSAGMDGMVKVWDVTKRDRPVTIDGVSDFTAPIAFSPSSGRILAAWSERMGKRGIPEISKMTIWNSTGKALGSFATPVPKINAGWRIPPMVLSPDGTRSAMIVFLGNNDDPKGDAAELRMIEVDSGKTIFTRNIEHMVSWSTALAFSPDGSRIAWGFAAPSATAAPVPAGRLVPRGSSASQLRVLDSTDGAEVQRIEIGEEYISSVAFGPDSKHVVISTYGPHAKVAVWNVRTGERLVEMSGLDSAMSVEKVVASNDGKRLAGILGGKGYGTKAEVIVWDAATGKSLFTLPGHSGQFANVAFSRNGRRIATAIVGGPGFGNVPPETRPGNEIKLWDADTGNELMTLKDLNHNTAQSLAFNADGTKLFAVAPVGRGPVKKIEIRTWDATPRE